MDPMVFRAFIKTALALQVDGSNQTPPGYLETQAMVHDRYPDLSRIDPPHQEYQEDKEPMKLADGVGRHLSELAGLGVLAAPSVQELRHKPMKESTKAGLEVAGLGTLAAPYAHDLAMKRPGYAASRFGRGLTRLIGNGLSHT